MKEIALLSKLVEKIELEILTTEEVALIGGSADTIIANNCPCKGDNCPCLSNNCPCQGDNCPCGADNCPCKITPKP